MEYLEQYVREGRKFDYIISDITDVPIMPADNDKNTAEVNL